MEVGTLLGRPDGDAFLGPLRDSGWRFEEAGQHPAGLEAVLAHEVGLGEAGLDVAEIHVELPADVAGPIVVHERCCVGDCLVDAEDAGERLVIDPDALAGFLGGGLVDGADGDDCFADEAHLLHGQRRLLARLGHPAPGEAAEVAPGQHTPDAFHRERRSGVDVQDPRMRMRAAQELDPQHAGERKIGRIARIAGDLFACINTRQPLSDEGVPVGAGGGGAHARAFRRAFNSVAAVSTASKIFV